MAKHPSTADASLGSSTPKLMPAKELVIDF